MPLITSALIEEPPLNDRLGRLIVIVLLIFLITTSCVIVLVCQELSQYLLDVVQGFLLGLESLLMCLHAITEIIIIVVISHVG